jgi:hypothetical protein
MQLAFRKVVEEGTAKDKEFIRSALFDKKQVIQPAPKNGNIPVNKIQRAVDSVSKKNEG